MMPARIVGWTVAALGVLILLANTLFVVGQTRQVVVLRLGQLDRTINAPGTSQAGLHFKIPFIETLVPFDKLNLSMDRQKEEVTTSNQAKMVVDAFMVYRISNPAQFYTAAKSETNGELVLQRVVNSALREALGTATTDEIVSTRRDDLMRNVRDDVAKRVAASRIGVQVIDLRIKRADLPEANEERIFERMKTQRQQEAQQIRAEGEQRAKDVLGKASKDAETTRGEADADRARIFAQAYGKDPSFAAFYRSMRAYEDALADPNRPIILSPDSEFFRYLKQGPGGK